MEEDSKQDHVDVAKCGPAGKKLKQLELINAAFSKFLWEPQDKPQALVLLEFVINNINQFTLLDNRDTVWHLASICSGTSSV